MTRYKQTEFEDEDSSSIGSIALNSERISTSATHIRYHTVSIEVKGNYCYFKIDTIYEFNYIFSLRNYIFLYLP